MLDREGHVECAARVQSILSSLKAADITPDVYPDQVWLLLPCNFLKGVALKIHSREFEFGPVHNGVFAPTTQCPETIQLREKWQIYFSQAKLMFVMLSTTHP